MSLNHRIAYLGLADFDYLSARVLMWNGVQNTGLQKAAEPFEKILKVNLMLEAKISRNEELTPRDLVQLGHHLGKLLEEFRARAKVTVHPDTERYLAMLQDAYAKRYPEHWKRFEAEWNVGYMDAVYVNLRDTAVENFPKEERERARSFGTFLGDLYKPDVIKQLEAIGARSPWELLAYKNDFMSHFNIEPTTRAKGFP
jgi:hypothetical protein